MIYEAFVVEIRLESDGSLGVGVLRSPAGQGRARFVPPFDATELGGLGVDTRRINTRDLRPKNAAAGPLSLVEAGDRLFRAVFNGAVRHRFERSLGLVATTGANLCVQIEIDLRQPELAWLHNLPWELLYDAETEEFLCLSGKVQLVRYIDAPRPEGGRPPVPPLSILALVSKVRGYADLDLEQELQNLRQATRQEIVELVVVEDACREALAVQLAKQRFRVLHFLGHAWFDEERGEGGLVFQDSNRAPDPIAGSALATELKAYQDLEIVVLNSCSTARVSSANGQSPFLGAATALVLAGVPCVIAMQVPISDAGAIAFSRALYQSLASGDAIETAVYAGRMAIGRLNRDNFEWSTPVLFLRRPIGGSVVKRRWSHAHRKELTFFLTFLALAALLLTAALWRPLKRHELRVSTLPGASLNANHKVLLVAYSYVDRKPISGLQFWYHGGVSLPTNGGGATELDLPASYPAGRQIKIDLTAARTTKGENWFLINDLVNIPGVAESAALMLIRGSEMRQIGAEIRDRSTEALRRPGESAEQRRRVLAAVAGNHGLTFGQLQKAIELFVETPDAKDRGIALYLQGKYFQAEEILTDAATKKALDFVDTLHYLGASQLAQAKFHEAADTFRKALSLRSDDSDLLCLLGEALFHLDEWSAAEAPMRRALEIDEKTFGLEHPKVARDLNDLGQLLQATNRLSSAESLMRRALAINERSLGPQDPEVASNLNNLALLLQATNRAADAEPLMRRALSIDEKNLGPEHPEVATNLNNLALVLQANKRDAEAELLMRRAIVIYQKRYGPEYPDIATTLNNLAALLTVTNRSGEAEPLLRRALAIDEKILGPEHHRVATDLVNLALALQVAHRLVDAEPLMRRAVAINEKIYGPEHPDVAICLFNLGRLLQIMNRPTEAEPLLRRALASDVKSYGSGRPEIALELFRLAEVLQATHRLAESELLLRRALAILVELTHRSGHPHPLQDKVLQNYSALLSKRGRPQPEIDAAIEKMVRPPR